MLVVREFEFFESENCIVVFPCEGLGATQGEDLQDAIEFAADWLYWTVIYDMINEKPIEKFELGHEPQHGGIVIPVAVDCSLARVEAFTAAETARILGVSPARVTQMCESGQLTSWKEGSRRMVLKESVDNRLIEQPGPGRPKYDEDEVIDMSPAEYTKFVQDFYDARMRELEAEEGISVVKKSKSHEEPTPQASSDRCGQTGVGIPASLDSLANHVSGVV